MTEETASSSPIIGRPDKIPKVLIKQASDSDHDRSHHDTEGSNTTPKQNGHNDENQQSHAEASPETGESTSAANNKDSLVNDRPNSVEATSSTDDHEKQMGTEKSEENNESFNNEALLMDKNDSSNAENLAGNKVEDEHDQNIVKEQEQNVTTENASPKTEDAKLHLGTEQIDDIASSETNATSETPLPHASDEQSASDGIEDAQLQLGMEQIDDIASSETNAMSETHLPQATDERSASDVHEDENISKPTEDSEIAFIPNMVDESAATDTEKTRDDEVTEENDLKSASILDREGESANKNENISPVMQNANETIEHESIKSTEEAITQPENTSVSSEEKIEEINNFDPYDASVSGNEDDTSEKHFDTPNTTSNSFKVDENLDTANEPKTNLTEDMLEAQDSHDKESTTSETQPLATVDESEQNEWVSNTGRVEKETILDDDSNTDALPASGITTQEQQHQPTSEVESLKIPSPAPTNKSVHFQNPPDDSNNDFDAALEFPTQPSPEHKENEIETKSSHRPTTPAIMKSIDLEELSDNERPNTPEVTEPEKPPAESQAVTAETEENELVRAPEAAEEEVEEVIVETDELEDNNPSQALQKELENMKRIKEEEDEANKRNIQRLTDEINRLKEENEAQSEKAKDMSLQIKLMASDTRESVESKEKRIETLEKKLKQLQEENDKYKEELEKRETQLNGTTTTAPSKPPQQKKSSVCNIL